jgi:hypothetical protein
MRAKTRRTIFGMNIIHIIFLLLMACIDCITISVLGYFVSFVIPSQKAIIVVTPITIPNTPKYTVKVFPTITNTLFIPTETIMPTHRPSQTLTRIPTRTNTLLLTEIPFYPDVGDLPLNDQNYPRIYDPPYLLSNPSAFRNKYFSVELYVEKIVNINLDGVDQFGISLNIGRTNSPYYPLLVFGLTSTYPYARDPTEGDKLLVYAIGMGAISRQTLYQIFGDFWILPNRFYTNNDNWIVTGAYGRGGYIK